MVNFHSYVNFYQRVSCDSHWEGMNSPFSETPIFTVKNTRAKTWHDMTHQPTIQQDLASLGSCFSIPCGRNYDLSMCMPLQNGHIWLCLKIRCTSKSHGWGVAPHLNGVSPIYSCLIGENMGKSWRTGLRMLFGPVFNHDGGIPNDQHFPGKSDPYFPLVNGQGGDEPG